VVQSRDQMNRGAGLGVAVREFATGIGPVDYALFVDRTLCGVLEAKPDGTTLSGFAEKAERYRGSVPEHLVRREGRVRFEYVASGTEIRFRSHADPVPRSRRVFFFHRPVTLRRWLADPVTIRARLQAMPPLVTAGLRDCQIEAVAGLDTSLAADNPRALIQAATGAGKTLLRLPAGIFYKQGVKANVLFFDKKRVSAESNTKHLWIYDPRTNQRFTLKERPMVRADLDDFVACYKSGRWHERVEAERFRRFAYPDLIARDKVNLDIFWLKDDTLDDPDLLPPPDEIAAEIVENLEAALDRFRKVALSLNGIS
jgi:type I site-specific restriction endonuclease